MLDISVLECDWGDADRDNIKSLLQDVSSHIVRELRDPFNVKIRVMNLPTENSPRTFYKQPSEDTYEVNLTSKGRHWSQCAYQFAHEFCHVIARNERLRDNPNNWFHEAICELASIFALRRMGERWHTQPPYPNWATYSEALIAYANDLVDKYRSISPVGSFSIWLSETEEEMRECAYLRDKNGIVALRLLPVFEEYPHGWNTVRQLPVSTERIAVYIEAWKASVQHVDRSFVGRVGAALGMSNLSPGAS